MPRNNERSAKQLAGSLVGYTIFFALNKQYPVKEKGRSSNEIAMLLVEDIIMLALFFPTYKLLSHVIEKFLDYIEAAVIHALRGNEQNVAIQNQMPNARF